MMKRSSLLAALVLLSVFAGTAAMDSTHAQPNQASLNRSVQPPASAPVDLCLATAKTEPVIGRTCVGSYCRYDSDCWSCPGGMSAWYCGGHRCTPY
jgi:hypothetical protein